MLLQPRTPFLVQVTSEARKRVAQSVTSIPFSQVHSCPGPFCSDLPPVTHRPLLLSQPRRHTSPWLWPSDFRLMPRDQRAMTCPRSHVGEGRTSNDPLKLKLPHLATQLLTSVSPLEPLEIKLVFPCNLSSPCYSQPPSHGMCPLDIPPKWRLLVSQAPQANGILQSPWLPWQPHH